ncbi:MAG: efflux RND transporter permease subunit [Solirubrobacteraceae bacterium]
MGAIIRTSLRFRLLVVAVAAGLLVVGVAQLRSAPVDVLPEFMPPYAEIQTEALGLSSTEVENLITVPLEANMLNGVEGVDVIRSQSLPGLSSIVLVFEPGTDVYRGRQLIQERLAQASALPRVSKPPTLLQPLSAASRVMMIGLSSDKLSPIEKSVLARWTMLPRLMGVPGVANVAVWGMRDKQVQVLVDPERLRDRDVTLEQVVRTAGNAQIVSPLSFLEASTPGSGGFIETPQQRLQVRNVLERLSDPKQVGAVPVERTGGRLRLRDVAEIQIGHQPLIGDAIVGDGEGLLLVVEKFPGANVREVTSGVEAALETLRPGLAGMRTDTSVFRPASYIEAAIDNLTLALIVAAALLALALVALLARWRVVLAALVTVPVALVAAALVLRAFGETFNAISFAGLAVALVIVVDDAVVGVENVARRLREAREEGRGGFAQRVVFEATREVRGPLVFATIIALLAVVPVAIMEGRPGAFLEPLALAYALAVLAGTVVALTVTPALALLLFSGDRGGLHDSPLLDRIRPRYDAALSRFTRRPATAIAAAAACVLVALATLPLLDTSLIPTFEDRDVLVNVEAEPGTSNPRMIELATAVTSGLRDVEGVEDVGAHVGRAVTGDQLVDVNSGQVWVRIAADADYDATLARIKSVAGDVRGVDRAVTTYSAQGMRDVGALHSGDNDVAGDGLGVLTGADAPIVARVYGHDSAELGRQAERVRQVMSSVDGVADPAMDRAAEQPNLVIEVDLARAQRFGIKPGDVRRAEAALVQGIQVGSVFDDQKVFEVIVQGVPRTRASVADVRNLLIDRPGGGHVRLRQVADVRIEPAPVAIRREAVSRYLDVKASVEGRDAGAVAADIRAALSDISFPLEYHAEVLDDSTAEEINVTAMAGFALVAVFACLLLLQAAFRNWRLALVGVLLLPVALAGGVVAALAGGGELSLGVIVGLLALLGLVARAQVLSVRRLQELEWTDGETFGPELVLHGAQERLAPVLATAAGVALCTLPFVVMGSRAGLEIVHPMAVVILGGMLTTTFVALFVLPALYLRFGVATPAPTLEADGVAEQQWTTSEIASAPLTATPPAANAEPPR